jgi:hypothetical protein
MNDGLNRQNMDIRLLLAGGKSSIMDYFTAGHPHAAVCASLKKTSGLCITTWFQTVLSEKWI